MRKHIKKGLAITSLLTLMILANMAAALTDPALKGNARDAQYVAIKQAILANDYSQFENLTQKANHPLKNHLNPETFNLVSQMHNALTQNNIPLALSLEEQIKTKLIA